MNLSGVWLLSKFWGLAILKLLDIETRVYRIEIDIVTFILLAPASIRPSLYVCQHFDSAYYILFSSAIRFLFFKVLDGQNNYLDHNHFNIPSFPRPWRLNGWLVVLGLTAL